MLSSPAAMSHKIDTTGNGVAEIGKRFLLYLVCLAVGMWWAFYPTLLSGFRRMEVNTGDTRMLNFVLEYSYRWVGSWLAFRPISLWDQPFFFPARNVGAYSEIFIGSAPIYWLLRVIQIEPDTAFQIWMIVVLLFDFASMALFLRRCLGFGPLASGIGAFLFAFGSPRLAQLGHQQLLPHFFTLFGLYGLFRFFEPRRMTARQGIYLFFLCLAAQLWAGFYLGWYLFFALLVATTWALCLRRFRAPLLQHLSKHWTGIAAAGAMSMILVAPMAYHYLKAAREVGSRRFADIVPMIPPLQSWAYLGGQSWLYSWLPRFETFRSISYEHEQHLGVGWVTLILAVVGFRLYQKRHGGWLTVVGLSALTILLVMTLYPGGFTPWKYLFRIVPGGTAIRAVARVALLMLIPLSIGLAYLIDTRKSLATATVIALICIGEQAQHIDAYDKIQLRTDVAAISAQVTKNCTAFYYSPFYGNSSRETPPQYELHIDAMWVALQTGVPTLNGYSGNAPKGWWDLWSNKAFDDLSKTHLREAIVRWSAKIGRAHV